MTEPSDPAAGVSLERAPASGSSLARDLALDLAQWETPVCGLLLAWFAGRVVYLAFAMHPFVPPDEVTHLGRVLAYAQVWGVPDNGPGTFELGLVDQRPWLYYWVVARGLSLDWVGMHELIFARLLNGALGLATVWIGLLWFRDWLLSPWARVLALVILTNTLMFTGLSASVSYDNGANLLAAAAVLAFTRFRRRHDLVWLLVLAACVLAGCLTKRTFLPLACLLGVSLVWREWRVLPALGRDLGAGLRRPAVALLLGLVLLLAGFTAGLYGTNLLRYGTLQPGFDQVVGEANAMSNRVFARNRILERFRSGEIDLEEARAEAGRIRHAGDRGDTLFLLRTAQLPESSVVGRVPYVAEWWYRMLRSSLGYLGHRHALKSDDAMIGYALVMGAAGLVFLRRWRPGDAGGVPADAAFWVLGYAFILMWLVNYPNYQSSRYIDLALQGRYLFPVLLPIAGLVAWSLGERVPVRARPWIVVPVALFYLYGDLPWLLGQIDERWLMPA